MPCLAMNMLSSDLFWVNHFHGVIMGILDDGFGECDWK
jgi:hypothetical protein